MELTIESIEEVLSHLYVDGGRDLDLRSVTFIDPYALLVLDLAVRDARATGRPLRVEWPTLPAVRRWMIDMRFFADTKAVSPDLPLRETGNALQPIMSIESERHVSHLVAAFERRLSERFPIDDAPRRRFLRILLELCQNIPQHSNATGDVPDPHGIAAMQDYDDGVLLAIADKGIGFRRSLALRGGMDDLRDTAAISSVVLDGISRFRDPGHGRELQRIFRLVRAWDGTIAIRSGGALLYHGPLGGDLYDVAPFPGVQIALRIPRRVFGIGEPPDGEPGVAAGGGSGFNE
ncbi:MAG: hypothetical protein AB7V19_08170 [Candidatus Bipolaricaulia bacterium]